MSTAALLQQGDVSKAGYRVELYGSMATKAAKAISDEFSRRILASIVAEGKTIQEISREQGIPTSTCYRRAREMVDEGLLVVERIVITRDGKKYAVYRSAFKTIEIASDLTSVSAFACLNEDVEEKFRYRHLVASYQEVAVARRGE